MKIAPAERETLFTTSPTGNLVEKTYLGGVVSHNIPLSTANEWVSGTNYSIGSTVKIDALKGEYVSLVDSNTAYPPTSSQWVDVTTNEYKFRNGTPDSQTVSQTDIEVIYEVGTNNFIVGLRLEGVKEVVVEELDNTNAVLREIYRETMESVIFFDCYTCCNVFEEKNRFRVPLDGCGTLQRVRVRLIGAGTLLRKIGVLGLSREYVWGCLQVGADVKLTASDKYVVEEGNLAFEGGGSIVSIDGEVLVEKTNLNMLYQVLRRNANKLNFYVVDETDFDMGDMIGSHQSFSIPYTNSSKVKMEINIIGVN